LHASTDHQATSLTYRALIDELITLALERAGRA
jgi:hypothetical protein